MVGFRGDEFKLCIYADIYCKRFIICLLCFWAIEKELLPIKKMHADGCKFNQSL